MIPGWLDVYFDLSGIAGLGRWQEKAGLVATRIRQLGIDRMLFGSDSGTKEMPGVQEAWAAIRSIAADRCRVSHDRQQHRAVHEVRGPTLTNLDYLHKRLLYNTEIDMKQGPALIDSKTRESFTSSDGVSKMHGVFGTPSGCAKDGVHPFNSIL